MGEPPADFKEKVTQYGWVWKPDCQQTCHVEVLQVHKSLLAEKQEKVTQEWKRRKMEKEQECSACMCLAQKWASSHPCCVGAYSAQKSSWVGRGLRLLATRFVGFFNCCRLIRYNCGLLMSFMQFYLVSKRSTSRCLNLYLPSPHPCVQIAVQAGYRYRVRVSYNHLEVSRAKMNSKLRFWLPRNWRF